MKEKIFYIIEPTDLNKMLQLPINILRSSKILYVAAVYGNPL